MSESSVCSCSPGPLQTGEQEKKPLNKVLFYAILGVSLALWIFIYYWLESAANFITFSIFNFTATSQIGSSLAFFIFDAPKVLMLLVLIIFVVGIIRSFFSPERTRQMLAGKKEFIGNMLAGGLGIVTPFCSCSAVPLFIGFVETGIPLGITLSFLIASPMVNEVALVMLYGMFGWQVALIYLVAGLVIAILAGWIIGKLKMEKYIEDWVFEIKTQDANTLVSKIPFEDRIKYGLNAIRDIVGKVWPYVLAGIAVGAFIHGYVPEGLLASFMGKSAWWSVPAAVLIGVPMYSNAAGIIPIVQALMEKGAALGTSLAFMMAVVGLSLPELIILRKVLKWRLIAVFVGVLAIGFILIGYLFNAFL
jgi:uncharacterized protein